VERLSVRQVEEYIFCPMVFYFKEVLGIEAPVGLWSAVGRQVQEELAAAVEERFKVIGRQVYIESSRLPLCGTVDYVVEGPAPLEIKYTKRLKPWWKYTLVLYALLVEEAYGRPVKAAYLATPGPSFLRLLISDHDRQFALHALNSALKVLHGETPRPHESKSCRNCDYRWLCKGQNSVNAP